MQDFFEFEESASSGIIGDPLGDYESSFTDIEIVSRSGFNLVCRAKRYGRLWLLKGLGDKFRNEPIYRTMLRKEFDLMMHLHHPNVVLASSLESISGLGECIVMEYIDGINLREWLQQELPVKRKQNVALQIIAALQYVHSCGIVHRDLKPENIMVTRNGDIVKLIDFGLSDSDSYDILKQAAGTPGYISPEQEIIPEADIRNDIYSLGCVIRDINPGRNFNRIAERCLLPANKRFKTIPELVDSLEALNRRKKHLFIALATLAAILLTLITILSVTRLEKITYDNTKTIDSLGNNLTAAISVNESLSDTIRQLNDSVTVLNSTIKASERQLSSLDSMRTMQEKHNLAVEAALAKGKRLVDKKWNSITARYDGKSAISAGDVTEYYRVIDTYVNSLNDDISSVEKDNLRQSLLIYSGQNIQKWNQKLLNMR